MAVSIAGTSSTTRRFRRDPRDQRHAVHRRDAGAADHLHGGGAAVDRRPADRSADVLDREPQKKPDKPTYVSIKSDLTVAIGETTVKRVDLVRTLDAAADSSKDRFIFLRADKAVPYGELMDVLEMLRAGGYTKIKLVALEGVRALRRTALRQALSG